MTDDGLGSAATVALAASVPILVLMLTSFVKISVVLSLLRNAIGSPDAPSGLVVMGLSLILTFFVMAPVGIEMIQRASETAPAAPDGQGPPSTTPSAAPVTPTARTAPTVPAGPVGARTPTAAPTVTSTSGAGTPTAPTVPATAPTTPSRPTGPTTVPSNPTAATTPTTPTAPTVPATSDNGVPVAASPTEAATPSAGKPVDLGRALRVLVPAKHHETIDRAERAIVPLRAFLTKHAGTRDRETFVALAQRMGNAASGDELWVLAPAFLTTELREAFAIAVLLFVPFLVIDLIVGLSLAALGLATTSPQNVALPLKLLLFVAVDGWRLLIEGLLRGYV